MPPPPSVLHVAESTVGGIGIVIAGLAAEQAARGWRVSAALPPDDAVRAAVSAAGGVHVPWDPGSRPGPRLAAQVAQVRAAVRAAAPDVVHLHSSMAGLCGRLAVRRNLPTLFQPHSWSFFARGGAAAAAAVHWERAAARWTDAVLCVSDDERRAGQRAGVRTRYVVVPNGVDLERFRPADAAGRAAARADLGLGEEPLALCLGRLHRQKGQARLLDAWPAVLDAVPDARLVLLGDGPDRAALEARRPPRTVLAGAWSDVTPWLAAADVVVQPSTWEGMSLAVLEALACGRSVVVTDVPGMAEVVRPGAGAVVPLGDATALAAAVAARLLDGALRAREGAAARRLVERTHDVHRCRAEVLRVTADLASAAA